METDIDELFRLQLSEYDMFTAWDSTASFVVYTREQAAQRGRTEEEEGAAAGAASSYTDANRKAPYWSAITRLDRVLLQLDKTGVNSLIREQAITD